jgi:hypothetical protein
MIPRLSAACLAMVLSCPTALQAGVIESAAPISAVTVYPDRAEVTRLIESEVPAGATTIVITGLPLDLMPDSVRVSGEASGTLLIGSIETTSHIAEAPPVPEPDPKIEAEIQTLRDRRRAAEDRIAVARMQIDYYALILQAAPEVADKQLIRTLDAQQWQQVWGPSAPTRRRRAKPSAWARSRRARSMMPSSPRRARNRSPSPSPRRRRWWCASTSTHRLRRRRA